MNNKNRYYIVAFLLAVFVFGLYFNILDNEATNWDDPALFKRTAIHDINMDNLKKVMSFNGGGTYQPIRDLTYMLDFELWGGGIADVVFGMHLHSIVLYILMILACWLFLLELFKAFSDDHEFCFIWACIASVLFAVHPVHVESVAWLYARKEPLLGLFTFISLWAFVRARTYHWKYYLISLISLVLAILSKPTAVMIPAVMFVIDLALQSHQRQPSFWKKRLMLYIPMLLVAIPMVVRLLSVMYQVGGVKPYHGGSFWTNLFAVSQILINYLGLIGFTINYSADYPIALFTDIHAWQAWMFAALNVMLIASGVAAYFMKRYIYAIFVAWFYFFLLPVSHIFPISQIMADRYALLSSLSWCVLLGFGIARLWRWRLSPGRLSPEFPLLVACALFCVVTASYSYMTYERNDIWQNSQVLWEDALAKYPDSSPANVNLSAIYLGQRRFREVQELCLAAIKAKPYDYLAISNLALAQVMMKQYENAINNYKQAIKLKPDLPKAEMGLALAYWGKGDYENAYLLYSQLMREGKVPNPESEAQYYYRLGFSSWKMNRRDQAYVYLSRAEKMAGDRPILLRDLGMAYNSMGDIPKAVEMFEDAIPQLQESELKSRLIDILDLLKKRHGM
ncbi:MAG: tetratricopeptide repeat protein [Deltaproteobacteria bacterium]|nr:tetratricopeptide repeat protein [Deltaproteobacteria bacterium]